MNVEKKIAKNIVLMFCSQTINIILGFFYVMITARYLGAEGFGIISFALSFVGIFVIFSDLGLDTLAVRNIARNKETASRYIGNNIIIRLLLLLIISIFLTVVLSTTYYPDAVKNVIYVISLSMMINVFIKIFKALFQSYEKMEYQSIGDILNSILMFIGTLFSIQQGFDVVGFALIYLITNFIVLTYVVFVCFWKFGLPKLDIDIPFMKSTIIEAIPFGMSGLFVYIYFLLDSVILSYMVNIQAVGYYNAAYKLVQYLYVIPIVINISIFPAMSKLYIDSKESLLHISERYMKLMLIIGIPMGVGITVLSSKIIELIYGTEYNESVIVLQVLIWSMVLIFINASYVRMLEASNKQAVISKINFISLIINIISNLLLIPIFGIVGSCIATILSQSIVIILVYIVVYKLGYNMHYKKYITITSKILISSGVMGVIIFYLDNISIFLTIPIAIVAYFTLLYLIKGVNDEDLVFIKSAF